MTTTQFYFSPQGTTSQFMYKRVTYSNRKKVVPSPKKIVQIMYKLSQEYRLRIMISEITQD